MAKETVKKFQDALNKANAVPMDKEVAKEESAQKVQEIDTNIIEGNDDPEEISIGNILKWMIMREDMITDIVSAMNERMDQIEEAHKEWMGINDNEENKVEEEVPVEPVPVVEEPVK